MEALCDLGDRLGVYLSVRQRHLHAVLLVLVAQLAVAHEANLLGLNPFPCELGERPVSHFS